MDMVDVTVHIDECVDHEYRDEICNSLLGLDGIYAAVHHDERPHLMMVEYDPFKTNSRTILSRVQGCGVHAELIGL